MAVSGGLAAAAVVGAVAANQGRDKKKGLTATQTSAPWSAQKPYLTYGFEEAKKQYQNPSEYYPDQTYAGSSDATLAGLQKQEDRAMQGSELFNSARDQNLKTIQGDYLNPDSNPYLQGTIDSANKGLIRNFNTSVIPQLQGAFSGAGRYGSGLQQQAQNDASYNLLDQMGTNAQNISYGNYNDERGRMTQAIAGAPAYAQADYMDAANLLDVGGQREAIDQQGIDEAMNRYNYEQEAPRNSLADYMGLIQGNYGGTSTSTSRNPNYKSSSSALLGGAASGIGLGASLMRPQQGGAR